MDLLSPEVNEASDENTSFLKHSDYGCASLPVEVGTPSHCVVCKMLLALFIPKVLQGVGPQQVAHGPIRWRLFESV